MFRTSHALVLLLSVVLVPLPCAALQRAFVASYGSDANTATNCVLASPCRGFAAAMTVIDFGGEIVALDAAGYGAVTIDKSVTIVANPGFYAGIAAPTGTAVNIAGDPGISVTLRGLNINGVGAINGVLMSQGSRLTIENCVITNFTNGVVVTGATDVVIVDTLIRDHSTYGVAFLGGGATATLTRVRILGIAGYALMIAPVTNGTTLASLSDSVIAASAQAARAESTAAGRTPRLSITHSTIANNSVGIASVASGGGLASVVVSNSTVTGSGSTGLFQSGAATLHSLGNNMLTHNVADTTGTISAMAAQ